MDWIERESGVAYGDSEVATKAHRVLADHGRAMSLPDRRGRRRRRTRAAATSAAACSAARSSTANRIGLDGVYRLPAVVDRADGRRLPRAARARRARSSASCGTRRSASRETLARGLKVFDELAGQDAITARRRVHARRDVRLPDRADAGARRGARPGGRRRRLPRADGGAPRDLARRRREHDAAARRGARRRAGFAERSSSATRRRDVLTAVIDAAPAGGTRQLVKLEQSPVLRGGRRPGERPRLRSQSTARTQRLDVVDVLKFGDDQVLVVELGGHAPLEAGTRVEAVVNWSDALPDDGEPHRDAPAARRRCARCSATTSSRRARRCAPTSCASTSRTTQQLTPEERDRVERIVNEKVFEAIPVRTFVTPIEEARKLGAMMLFGEKYGDEVRVVEIDGFSTRALRRHARALDRRDRAVRDPRARARSARARAGSRRSPPARRGRCSRAARASSTTSAPSSSRRGARRRSRSRPAAATRPGHRLAGPRRRRVSSPRSRARAAARCATSPTSCGSSEDATAVVLASADDGKVALVVNLDKSRRRASTRSTIVRELGADHRRRRRRPADARARRAARTSTACATRSTRAATGSPPRSA